MYACILYVHTYIHSYIHVRTYIHSYIHIHRLTAGIENILLYYVTLDEGRGVVISPCDEHTSNQPVNTQLLIGFKDVVGTIHQILHKKYKEQEEEEEEDEMIRVSVLYAVKLGLDISIANSILLWPRRSI